MLYNYLRYFTTISSTSLFCLSALGIKINEADYLIRFFLSKVLLILSQLNIIMRGTLLIRTSNYLHLLELKSVLLYVMKRIGRSL